MSKSKKILLFLIVIILVIINILVFYYMFLKEDKQEVEEGTLIKLEDTEDYKYNLGLYEDTMSDKDAPSLNELPQRVTVAGTKYLLDNGYPTDGIDSLQFYLDRYLNYYEPDGPNYYADVKSGSYEDSDALPAFKILVHISDDKDMEIYCVYMKGIKRYQFFSELSNDAIE